MWHDIQVSQFPFATPFLARLGEAFPTEETGDLDRQLVTLFDRGRGAYPDLELDPVRFIEYLADRLPPAGPLSERLATLHAEDLYLACGCYEKDTRALRAFDEQVLSHVPRFVARVGRSPELADSVRQELREKLFVSADAPKIGEYGGRGPLAGWVRVAAIRTALNMERTARRAGLRTASAHADAAAPAPDPELDIFKSKYAAEVKLALENAVAALPIETRNVLRQHYLDGLTIDQIASVTDVHRSTAARWIEGARRTILTETKQLLRARLRVTTTEVDSIVALVQSQLELSMHLLLR
jgi:RNA polymerase sigma-70 factor, ECF subfamily